MIIYKLTEMSSGCVSALPFTLILDDPTGNSHIQNFLSPLPDPQLQLRFYPRTAAQDTALGNSL